MSDITKIKVDGEPESSYKLFPKNREFEKRAGGGNGGSHVHPDWNQNDDTQPDYVKNRPFYTGDPVETVFLEEITAEFTVENEIYGYNLTNPLLLENGQTYRVSWDGTIYECIGTYFGGETVLGNLSIVGTGVDTGEPFLYGFGAFTTLDTSASHTISISGFVQEVVKIDKKYLPSTIPFMEDGKIPQRYVQERFPNADDIFGGKLVISTKDSTLANPYPNKTILQNLTVEAFNAMFNNQKSVPRQVTIDNNLAMVSFIYDEPRSINVRWSDCRVYSTSSNSVAGACVYSYQAKIHEDTDNPGTMVSECAAIMVARKELT